MRSQWTDAEVIIGWAVASWEITDRPTLSVEIELRVEIVLGLASISFDQRNSYDSLAAPNPHGGGRSGMKFP